MLEAQGDRSAEPEPSRTADARILGQLLASQSILPVLPTAQHVADFLARALTPLPGVSAARVCLAECSSDPGRGLGEPCAACEAGRGRPGDGAPAAPALACALSGTPGVRVLPLATERQRLGFFVLALGEAVAFEPYRPFLRNLANSLALFLENRAQQASLLAARDALERRVEERTAALTVANLDLAQEIDERRRAEAEVRELNQELRRSLAEIEDLYQNAPCGYHSLAPDGTYLRVNDTELRWLGRARDEVVHRLRLQDLLDEEDRAGLERNLAELGERGAVQDLEAVLLRRDGSELPVLLCATAVRAPDGRFLGSRATMYDQTDRRRAERALRESEERFRQSQKLEAVGRLAGGVAHDFNNLLTVILSCAGALREGCPEGDPRRVEVEELGDAARRAAHLTRQLLAFSRRQATAPTALDLGAVAGGMESLLRRLIGEDVALDVVRAPALGRVLADAGQLEQVILNLAVNARDAMPAGGRIRIETANLDVIDPAAAPHLGAPRGRYVTLSVQDTGTGISPESRAHLFEPFFTTKEKGKGTGLGLATVYGIVRQAGGEIRVESEPDRGTTFVVLLPRIDDTVLAAPSAEPSAEATPGGSETVLLVEDDPLVRAATGRALRAAGYTIIEAADGEEALARARAATALDVLVTDVVMPRLGGPALAERIRALRGPVPTLFVSGYTEEGLLQPELEGGRARILWKPFTAVTLARAVRALIDGSPALPADRASA